MYRLLGIVGCLLVIACQRPEKVYVKTVTFPQGTDLKQKIEMAGRVVPSQKQYDWQQLELTAFVHFGMNTFTDQEWGTGREEPSLFSPTELDCEQWVKALKEGGFRMVILTAKHHDGFCLWPTATTPHSVAFSSWKNGKGDVVRDLKDACDKYDMKFGIYLSPWDRNAECYGDSPRYNRMFAQQLTELLSNYGTIHEIWFDGANAEGPNGRKQIYDWDLFCRIMDSLQPQAVRAIMGDDIRWVGNEKGLGRETEWSVTALVPGTEPEAETANARLGLNNLSADLGSREVISRAEKLFWYPSEVDVSIRPGWFYHAHQDNQVKSLKELVDIYFCSVGYNSVLLLNVPPDRRGLIHEKDVARLKEFGDYLRNTFSENKAESLGAIEMQEGESREIRVNEATPVNTVLLGEDILCGQRVEEFTLEALKEGIWQKLGQGTTIGYKRLLRFPACRVSSLRLKILRSRGTVHIREVGAYQAPEISAEWQGFHVTDVLPDAWKVVEPEKTGEHPASYAIDKEKETFWQTELPEKLTVDMGKRYHISGFTYVPVSSEDKGGIVFRYRFWVSEDGKRWTACSCPGEFGNIMYQPLPQTVCFERTYPARYFRFEPLEEIKNRTFIRIAEIGILLQK